jgi:hypothetical protein
MSNLHAKGGLVYIVDNIILTVDAEPEPSIPGENRCSFEARRRPALGVRVSRSRIADFQRPLISLERGRPREVGSRDMLNFRWFGASVGKQRGDKAQRIHFGAQAGQIHLFFSQHFVYVFHGHQRWANNGPEVVFM